MSLIVDGTTGVTFNDSSLQGAAASPFVLKNRIINGAMMIDQRNAGASGTALGYTVDRFFYDASQASKGTWQQNAGSVTPPAGYTNYFGFTSSSAYSVLAGDYFLFSQYIEGYNVADLAWGTASAKTVTLSFWVRSSLTGTFGGALVNGSFNRTYAFTYSIPTANTWTQISVTIAGDTSGTWNTTTGIGLAVRFGLGVGSTYSGTAGAWAATQYISATGATSVVGTNGATWYITGVQLEQNTSATPFERRLYNQELANCQRYYQRFTTNASSYTAYGCGISLGASTISRWGLPLLVPMRTKPSTSFTNCVSYNGTLGGAASVGSDYSTPQTVDMDVGTSGMASTVGLIAKILPTSNNTGWIECGAEL